MKALLKEREAPTFHWQLQLQTVASERRLLLLLAEKAFKKRSYQSCRNEILSGPEQEPCRTPLGYKISNNAASPEKWSKRPGVSPFLTSLVILMRSVAVSEYLPWLFRISALSKAQRSASTMFLPGNKGDAPSESNFVELEKNAPTHKHLSVKQEN